MVTLFLIVHPHFSGEINAADLSVCRIIGTFYNSSGLPIVGGKVIISFKSDYTAIRDIDSTVWIAPHLSGLGVTDSYGYWYIDFIRSHLLQYKDGDSYSDTVRVDITAYDQKLGVIFNAKNQVVPDSAQWCFRW